jgi:Predicted glycosyl hydrolase
MRHRLLRYWSAGTAAMLLWSAVWLASPPKPAHAFTAANAEQAMEDFLDVFYDPAKKYFYTNSDRQIHPHGPGPENGLYTDYWWEAQIWQTVMDAYERTQNSAYYDLIDDIYEGFVDAYPDWSENPYNDDIGWWALGAFQAYKITNNSDYLDLAQDMFDHMWNSWSNDFGGGIWWNTIGHLPQKNMATNGVAAVIAAKLSDELNDPDYWDKAVDLYEWVENTLYAGDGYVYDQYRQGEGLKDWEFTYNFGNFAGAALEMYLGTNDPDYLAKATDAVDWVIANMTVDGVTLLYEGLDDQPAFKMIFVRNVKRLIDEAGQTQYVPFLQANASQAWNHRRPSDGIIGPDWSLTPDSGYIQSIAAAAGVAMLFLVDPDNTTGIVPVPGPYEAENARHFGVSNEPNAWEQPGYTGRGYVAGWNTDGTSIVFPVVVQTPGTYTLTFRYSAGAGNAVRKLDVNGSAVHTALLFPGTGAWSNWQTVTVHVTLAAGTNEVRLAYDAASGSGNYLNADQLSVAPSAGALYEAEQGTLHNLLVEASHLGFTGSGYVAGWINNGEWVDLAVYAPSAGNYDLTFRYAGGAGNASRYLYINGAGVVNNLAFPGTGSWSAYSTVTVHDAPLNAGWNTVSLIFDSGKGSANYLNLDHLYVAP